jgi:hypothetical protein
VEDISHKKNSSYVHLRRHQRIPSKLSRVWRKCGQNHQTVGGYCKAKMLRWKD